MAISTVTAASIVVGSFDLSPFTGTISDTPGMVNVKPYSTFGGGGYEYQAVGIKNGKVALGGFADYTASTGISASFNAGTLAVQNSGHLAIPGTAAGDPAILWRGITSGVKADHKVDDIATLDLGVDLDAPFARGFLAAPVASRTTSGLTGTAVALTGPTASQALYATLNVTVASGTNLVVKVQSDDNSGFTTPTDRITFSTVSAVGSQWSSVAGNLSTETYWRVVATIATGTFTFSAAFGVA